MSKDKDIFAFPNTSDYTHKNGMTLRDYFAAKAMTICPPLFSIVDKAEFAYKMADAMLKEREK